MDEWIKRLRDIKRDIDAGKYDTHLFRKKL